jgi:16S rRNA (guanine966-N2)-methyltransferase
MRIVGGSLGGRIITNPKTRATRPMTEKMRAAIFDILGDVSDLAVMDAYAGSGAIGFEAASRGAGRVVAIESSRGATHIIQSNQKALDIDWVYSLYPITVESWLASPFYADLKFNVIVADPPYEQLKIDILEKLGQRLEKDGILAVSHSSKRSIGPLGGLEAVTGKVYGDSAISLYRR